MKLQKFHLISDIFQRSWKMAYRTRELSRKSDRLDQEWIEAEQVELFKYEEIQVDEIWSEEKFPDYLSEEPNSSSMLAKIDSLTESTQRVSF